MLHHFKEAVRACYHVYTTYTEYINNIHIFLLKAEVDCSIVLVCENWKSINKHIGATVWILISKHLWTVSDAIIYK